MDEAKIRMFFSRAANSKDAIYGRDMWQWLTSGPHLSRRFIHLDVSCSDKFYLCLQMIWWSASNGDKAEAKRRIVRLIDRYAYVYYNLREDPPGDNYESKEEAIIWIVESLVWLRRNVGKLKVCENRKCDTGKSYFFRVYSHDKYCSDGCLEEAKESRRNQRAKEKPQKQYKRSAEARKKMANSADRRWERERAKTGRPK